MVICVYFHDYYNMYRSTQYYSHWFICCFSLAGHLINWMHQRFLKKSFILIFLISGYLLLTQVGTILKDWHIDPIGSNKALLFKYTDWNISGMVGYGFPFCIWEHISIIYLVNKPLCADNVSFKEKFSESFSILPTCIHRDLMNITYVGYLWISAAG